MGAAGRAMTDGTPTPAWGYCTAPDCHEAAWPVWVANTVNAANTAPDLCLCSAHLGDYIGALQAQLRAAHAFSERIRVVVDAFADALRVAIETSGE